MKHVTLKQLRAFVTISREASFTRAASRLNVSQSALTLQIRELETEIGLRLFDRSSRHVELTAPGRDFQPVAERLLYDLSGALDNLHAIAERQRGSVSVVAGASVIALAIAPAIARLAKTYPGISVRVAEHVGDEVSNKITTGQADFGIGHFVRPSEWVKSSFLLKDRIGILCHAGHPLARKQQVRWSDLAPYPLATTLSQGPALRNMLDKDPAIHAVLPHPKYEASNIFVLMSIVEQGESIALLPGLMAFPAVARRLVFRPIQSPAMFRELFFVEAQRHTLSPAARQVALAILDQLDHAVRSHKAELAVASSDAGMLQRKLLAA